MATYNFPAGDNTTCIKLILPEVRYKCYYIGIVVFPFPAIAREGTSEYFDDFLYWYLRKQVHLRKVNNRCELKQFFDLKIIYINKTEIIAFFTESFSIVWC